MVAASQLAAWREQHLQTGSGIRRRRNIVAAVCAIMASAWRCWRKLSIAAAAACWRQRGNIIKKQARRHQTWRKHEKKKSRRNISGGNGVASAAGGKI
jgi:hypothetical protein